MKEDKVLKERSRAIMRDALDLAIVNDGQDWLTVVEGLAYQVAVQVQARHEESSGLLRMLAYLGKRLERAERRLEHYRRKEMRAHASVIWESILPRSAIGILNMAAWHRKNNDGCNSPDDPADIKRCNNLLRCAAAARMRMHSQGKGVP